jgi:hypothetical protein
MSSKSIHDITNDNNSCSFKWFESNPSCIYTTFYLSINLLKQNFKITIMNITAIKIGIHLSFWYSDFIPLNIYLKVRLLNHTEVLLLVFFEETLYCFHNGCADYIPSNKVWVPLFLYTCQYLIFFVFLIPASLTGVRTIYHCGFDLHFLED